MELIKVITLMALAGIGLIFLIFGIALALASPLIIIVWLILLAL